MSRLPLPVIMADLTVLDVEAKVAALRRERDTPTPVLPSHGRRLASTLPRRGRR